MSTHLSRDDARAVARVLYAVHQRRAARLAAQGGGEDRPDRQAAPPMRGASSAA